MHSKTFIPKKSFGQNFLIDPNIQNKIIHTAQLRSSDVVLEIGPGKGALTNKISDKVKKVYAIEKDQYLARQLNQMLDKQNVKIFSEDILKFDFKKIPGRFRVIGNLPYNIATAIIEKCIFHRKKILSMDVTIQLEHAKRLMAKPNSKEYGSLSCFVQYYANLEKCFIIKNTVFSPRPKVQSCFIKIHFLQEPKFRAKSEEFLFQVIRQAFSQRRKTILNSMSSFIPKEDFSFILKRLNISTNVRAENLSLRDYINISNECVKLR